MCIVVNIHSKARYTVYGGRINKQNPGLFGNKYIVGTHGKRGECVKLFQEWFLSDCEGAVEYRKRVVDKIHEEDTIGCFCKPLACHCDIVAYYVNCGYDLKETREKFNEVGQ